MKPRLNVQWAAVRQKVDHYFDSICGRDENGNKGILYLAWSQEWKYGRSYPITLNNEYKIEINGIERTFYLGKWNEYKEKTFDLLTFEQYTALSNKIEKMLHQLRKKAQAYINDSSYQNELNRDVSKRKARRKLDKWLDNNLDTATDLEIKAKIDLYRARTIETRAEEIEGEAGGIEL